MSSEFAASIVASLPDAVVSIDRTSTIVAVNSAAQALFGWSAEEFVGQTLAQTIIPSDFAAQHARGMEQFAARGHGPVIGKRIDIVARDRAGRRFPIELSVFLDPVRPGEIFHATIRDVSDRAAREASTVAERARLTQFLDAAADAWWDCTIDSHTVVSERFGALLHTATESIVFADPSQLAAIHPDDRARVAQAWGAHLDGSAGHYESTHRVIRADGAVCWLRDRGRAVEFANGRPLRVVGTTVDVTEHQGAEERLRNAQRLEMLGLLAGGFAHDLNNLLAAIRGQAALAATELHVTPAVIESLEAIQLATTKAKMLTTNMLTLGKPLTEAVRNVSVPAVIMETLQIARPGLSKSIAITVELAALESVEVVMDASAFQQAVLNLLLNARDAMPQGGRLRISGSLIEREVGAHRVQLRFADTGVGISPELLHRIFQPFFTTKPAGVGTGLGLAVVQQVIHGAHGTIEVQSDVGRGTTFIVELPVAPISAARGSDASRGSESCAPKHIVLTEDHPVLRQMLTEALRAEGHTVTPSGGGAETVRVATDPAMSAQVLVLDLFLPSMDGFRIHTFVEEALGYTVPVVFISSDPAAALPLRAPASMCLLHKPFEIPQLLDAVKRVVEACAKSTSATR